jgi:hypothetical protein
MEELVHIKGCMAFEPVIDCPRQLVSGDSQGLPLVVFFLQAGYVFFPCGIVAQEQHHGLGKGPLEMGITNFIA